MGACPGSAGGFPGEDLPTPPWTRIAWRSGPSPPSSPRSKLDCSQESTSSSDMESVSSSDMEAPADLTWKHQQEKLCWIVGSSFGIKMAASERHQITQISCHAV